MKFTSLSLEFNWVVAIMLIGVFSACEHAEAPQTSNVVKPTFESIQTNIFSQTCARSGCHKGSDAPLGLDLSEGKAYDNLVSIASEEKPEYKRVDPFNPDSSYLIMKLEGSDNITGRRMPLGLPALSDEKIDAIRTWINKGAKP